MNTFFEDLKKINNSLKVETDNVDNKIDAKVAMLPYYVDQNTNELMVVVKREILQAAKVVRGNGFGITSLKESIDPSSKIDINDVFAKTNVSAKVQGAYPFGNIMLDPKNSNESIDMVVLQIDQPTFLDANKGIIYQEMGQYEIGALSFYEAMQAINEDFVMDATTRMLFSELFIMVLEEERKQSDNGNDVYGAQGNISQFTNQPSSNTMYDEEVLAQNQQTDFGKIYEMPMNDSGNDSSKGIFGG